jgi:CheY-like chemotaxis protein
VTSPLALLCYEDLLPGSQLVNRLQDQGYRVQAVTNAAELPVLAAESGAMFIMLDLVSKRGDICEAIRKLQTTPTTAHLPIIAFADDNETALQAAGKAAGAKLVATDTAILLHLDQLIEQALQMD